MSGTTFDLVILGGGSGGYTAALRGAQLGLSVALIEKDKLGGTCLHWGCIPTKALLHAAELADSTRESEAYGILASFEGVDLPGVYRYRDALVDRLYKGLQGLVDARGITFVEGAGILTSATTVEAAGSIYPGTAVVLATGSYTRSLPGLEIGGRVITSYEALLLDYVPQSAIVLGGGAIGVEFASMWRSFGTDVTVVEALPCLIPNEDEAISKALAVSFRKRGIKVKTGARFEALAQDENEVTVTFESGETLQADLVLVAVGRGPSTASCGYEKVGVDMDHGFVLTDERLRTSVPSVYAVGDIVPGLQLAHRGFQQGIFVAEEVAGLAPRVIEEWAIPRVTYCEPEVASVGLTEAQARVKYGDNSVEIYQYNLGGNGRSQVLATAGFVKLIREKGGPVVGVHMAGSRVSELVGEAQLVVNLRCTPDDVAPMLHAHPTQNEAFGEAILALAGKPLHAHS